MEAWELLGVARRALFWASEEAVSVEELILCALPPCVGCAVALLVLAGVAAGMGSTGRFTCIGRKVEKVKTCRKKS